LRQAMLGKDPLSAHGLLQTMDRLSKDAGRFEADLARLASATNRASERIEEASLNAAKASHAAIEAADLTRNGARRIALQAEDNIAELIETVQRLSAALAIAQAKTSSADGHASREPALDEATAVLDGLIEDLDALEKFTERRKALESNEAVTLTAA